MEHKLSQQQRMFYKMVLTPQMRQSIKLLGMSSKELLDYIDSVVASNPFLQKLYDKKVRPSYETFHKVEDIHSVSEENPRAGLVSQLRMLGLNSEILEIVEYLIYEMDENGYITVGLEEVAEELLVDIDDVQKALEAIQGMEPAGIGAQGVRECMQLQLKRMGKEDSIEYTIVTNFIKELATNNAKKISGALNLDIGKVRKAIDNIKKLNPRPASTILSRMPERVVPDLIAKVEEKRIYLELNKNWLPHLKLYNPYEDKLEIIKDPEVKKFLKENMNAARHLIDGVKRREKTMCRVADYILTFQKDTFIKNSSEIKTLTIKNVSEALKLHPSTISRAVSNKYIQIDNEVMSLNSLLSHGIKKDNGEITSKTAIKNRIKELIKDEDKTKPLSDNAIKQILEKEGIAIKRRTVAKYRELLRLLPAHFRRGAAVGKIYKM